MTKKFKNLKLAETFLKKNTNLDIAIQQSKSLKNTKIANFNLFPYKLYDEDLGNPLFTAIYIQDDIKRTSIYYCALAGGYTVGIIENAFISDNVSDIYEMLKNYDYNEALLYEIRLNPSKDYKASFEAYEIYPFNDEIQNKFISQMYPKDTLKDGKGDNKTVEDIAKKWNVSIEFAQEQLNKGMKVESEHSDNPEKQKEIATDHLYGESINYYMELEKMEKKLESEDKEIFSYEDVLKFEIEDYLNNDLNEYIPNWKKYKLPKWADYSAIMFYDKRRYFIKKIDTIKNEYVKIKNKDNFSEYKISKTNYFRIKDNLLNIINNEKKIKLIDINNKTVYIHFQDLIIPSFQKIMDINIDDIIKKIKENKTGFILEMPINQIIFNIKSADIEESKEEVIAEIEKNYKGESKEHDKSKIDGQIVVAQHIMDLGIKYYPNLNEMEKKLESENKEKEAWKMTKKEFDVYPRAFQQLLASKSGLKPEKRIRDKNVEKMVDKMKNRSKGYTSEEAPDYFWSDNRNLHKELIQQALSENKPVPENVLAEYPDLKQEKKSELESEKNNTFNNTLENNAIVKALTKIQNTVGKINWTGNIIHNNLDKCLTALNLQSSNSGWYKPLPIRIKGLTGIYMINQDGSIFYEARIIKQDEKKYLIEYLTNEALMQFDRLYSDFINEIKNDSDLNKQLIKTEKVRDEEVSIYSVNGTYVRDNYSIAFTMGGHHYVSNEYEYIPDGEIWIDQDLNEKDKEATIVHELTEYELMKYKDMSYEKAHDIANEEEKEVREEATELETLKQENMVTMERKPQTVIEEKEIISEPIQSQKIENIDYQPKDISNDIKIRYDKTLGKEIIIFDFNKKSKAYQIMLDTFLVELQSNSGMLEYYKSLSIDKSMDLREHHGTTKEDKIDYYEKLIQENRNDYEYFIDNPSYSIANNQQGINEFLDKIDKHFILYRDSSKYFIEDKPFSLNDIEDLYNFIKNITILEQSQATIDCFKTLNDIIALNPEHELNIGKIITDKISGKTYEITGFDENEINLKHKPRFRKETGSDIQIGWDELLKDFKEKRLEIEGYNENQFYELALIAKQNVTCLLLDKKDKEIAENKKVSDETLRKLSERELELEEIKRKEEEKEKKIDLSWIYRKPFKIRFERFHTGSGKWTETDVKYNSDNFRFEILFEGKKFYLTGKEMETKIKDKEYTIISTNTNFIKVPFDEIRFIKADTPEYNTLCIKYYNDIQNYYTLNRPERELLQEFITLTQSGAAFAIEKETGNIYAFSGGEGILLKKTYDEIRKESEIKEETKPQPEPIEEKIKQNLEYYQNEYKYNKENKFLTFQNGHWRLTIPKELSAKGKFENNEQILIELANEPVKSKQSPDIQIINGKEVYGTQFYRGNFNGGYTIIWDSKTIVLHTNDNSEHFGKDLYFKNKKDINVFSTYLSYFMANDYKDIDYYSSNLEKFDTKPITELSKQDYIDTIEGLEIVLETLEGQEKQDYIDTIEGLKIVIETL